MAYSLKQLLGEGELKTGEKIDKIDEFITLNVDLVGGLLNSGEDLKSDEINGFLRTLHKMVTDLRAGLQKKLDYERSNSVDYHSPAIQRALYMILNMVVEALQDVEVEQVKLDLFKKLMHERLLGIEERLSRLSVVDVVQENGILDKKS
jgi:hypothetical protein